MTGYSHKTLALAVLRAEVLLAFTHLYFGSILEILPLPWLLSLSAPKIG